jgi:hypothetical protein
MAPQSLSYRERLIGAGLLRPADQNEGVTAHSKCCVYLQQLASTGLRNRSSLDHQLTLAVLERWFAL